MSGPAVEHSYRYLHASSLESESAVPRLRLATSGGTEDHPYFFHGQLVRPKRVAELLRSLMTVVHARHHVPPAMLNRILALADPVVTSSDERLRFEGFSACCGVYARVDLLPDAVRGESFGRGTTNVDFNAPTLGALSRIRDQDEITISVGTDEFRLTQESGTVIERKVQLPVRWLKGFVEVQAYLSRMKPAFEVSGIEARRFLRALPRMKTHRHECWVTAAGRGLRLSQRETTDGVRVVGLERLRVLEHLVPLADRLTIYSDPDSGASAWELSCGDARFHLALSPEVWRGFSGEGQVLKSLAANDRDDVLASLRAELRWQAVIDAQQIAERCQVDPATVEYGLAVLGSRGLVGYDLGDGCYFHRELPFDLSLVEKLQPRLLNARKLLEQDKVSIVKRTRDRVELIVAGSGVEHRVRITDDGAKCTCPWYAKHLETRGPCKHILAAGILLEEDEESSCR